MNVPGQSSDCSHGWVSVTKQPENKKLGIHGIPWDHFRRIKTQRSQQEGEEKAN